MGLGFESPISSFIRTDIGLQYFQKGSKNEMHYLGRLLTRTVYSLDVISLSACIKFKPLAKTSPYILAGGELSFVLGHKVSFTLVPEAPVENSLDRGTKKVDWGLVVGSGFEFAIARSWTPFVEIRYYAGLVDLNVPVESFADEHYPGFLKNRAVVLQIGIRFMLPGQNR